MGCARKAQERVAVRAQDVEKTRCQCKEDVARAERDVERAIADMHREEARARAAAEERARGEEFSATYGAWTAYRDALDARRCSLVDLLRAMEGFVAWVYARRALPAIQDEVNALLAPLAGGEGGLVLRGSCGGLEGDNSTAAAAEQQQHQQQQSASFPTGGNLEWTLNGTPLTKCSGMQRFAAALAMRLALSRLGACNVTCTHLLIDEGFGALDSHHITAVPDFLHTCILASGRFASVLLVSHLEGVREAADVVIPIRHRRPVVVAQAQALASSSLSISELRYNPSAAEA